MRTPEQLLQDAEPFPDRIIKTVGPRKDAYVKWAEYNQRMLLHHPDHDYRVTSVSHAPGYLYPKKDEDGNLTDTQLWAPPVWAIAVEFTIDGSVYAGVGEDDSPAAAESTAYKRACAHAGIGLHLYGGYWLHGRLVQGNGDGE